jgi:hypothetical protein
LQKRLLHFDLTCCWRPVVGVQWDGTATLLPQVWFLLHPLLLLLLLLLMLLVLQPSRWPSPGDLQSPLPDLHGYPAGRSVFFDTAATGQLSGSLAGLRRLQVLRLAGLAWPPAALSGLSQLRELR